MADLEVWGFVSALDRAEFVVRCVSYAAKCYAARCARHAAYSGLAHDASLGPLFGPLAALPEGGGDRLVAGDILVGS